MTEPTKVPLMSGTKPTLGRPPNSARVDRTAASLAKFAMDTADAKRRNTIRTLRSQRTDCLLKLAGIEERLRQLGVEL